MAKSPLIKALFDDAGITLVPSSKSLTGLRGAKFIDGLEIAVHVMPLRRSAYAGVNRVAASTAGYRLTIEIDCDVPIRFSVVHQGIRGSKLIEWVNKIKRTNRVSHDLLDRYQYGVWCNDTGWAENLLRRTEVSLAITNLLECRQNDANVGHPCVFISPTNILYFRRAESIDGFNNLSEHVSDIVALRKSAISVAAPTLPRQSSYLERLFKKHPVLAGGMILMSILFIGMLLVGSLLWLLL